ncbi:hypothetical protein HOY82DRAFT_626738 [Tuber indicum]|nr:hypothetical protein HOY82DRAFT_626738 [Tuber indicum]
MGSNRSLFRNEQPYNAVEPSGDALGGLFQNGSVTEENFLHTLGIPLVIEAPIRIQTRTTGHIISLISSPSPIGEYDIYCDRPVQLNNEAWVDRVFTQNVIRRERSFCTGIRARNGGCVISDVINQCAPYGWEGLEAAHIFPLEKGYGGWTTNMDDTVGISKIHSCQNRLPLCSHIHRKFYLYLSSVNPDVTVFDIDPFCMDGRTLDPVCRDPHRVSDNLFQGADQPVLETAFLPGTDLMGEIWSRPYAKEWGVGGVC